MIGSLRERVLLSLYNLLIPVARILIRAGVTYREFNELGRRAFVSVAESDFGLRGRQTNSSRIAAMTGLSRKEVSRLRASDLDELLDPRRMLSPLADIVHTWASDPQYIDRNGMPIPLGLEGSEKSLASLVRKCSRDLPVGAVRAELKRLGVIEAETEDRIELIRRNLIPDGYEQKLISAMSYSLRALADTVAFNTDPAHEGSTTRVERFIESRPLGPEEQAALRAATQKRLDEITTELELLLTAGEAREPDDGQTARIGVGLYFWE